MAPETRGPFDRGLAAASGVARISRQRPGVEMLKGYVTGGPIWACEAVPAAAQCRGRGAAGGGRRRWAAAWVRCSRVETAVAARGLTAAVADCGGGKGLAERLRLGSLLEDGLSFKESFIVRCYEVGINKTATVETIANLLQVLLKITPLLGFLFLFGSLDLFVLSSFQVFLNAIRTFSEQICVGYCFAFFYSFVLSFFLLLNL